MSNTATHSPSPWVVRKCDFTIEVTDAEGNAITNNQPYYPAALNPKNALLIAAAPEMLAALQEIIHNNQQGFSGHGAAILAINKATKEPDGQTE